jgi:hypothetical protein
VSTPELLIAQPGYWCECWTQSPATGEGPALLASFRAGTAAQAVRWIRLSLRTMTSGLDPEPAGQAWTWIRSGYLNDIEALTRNRTCAMTIRHGDTQVGWIARPTLFLPMAAELPAE